VAQTADDISAWVAEATSELAAAQATDGGWPYLVGQQSATEPTAMAVLALTAQAAVYRPADATAFLAARQRTDGLFTTSTLCEEAHAVSAAAGLALLREGQSAAGTSAAEALLIEPVHSIPNYLTAAIYGYDTQTRGWPWLPGDFSLTEPTAMSLIFLKQAGYSQNPRVREAANMLRARAIASGGWNYGEPRVWGGELFPAVAPTAMAVTALADEQDNTTAAAVEWLLGQQPQLTSLFSLSWAAIALNLLGLLDDSWTTQVIAQWQSAAPERRGPLETALCLLALSPADGHPLGVVS
jgi:hypothetical protein